MISLKQRQMVGMTFGYKLICGEAMYLTEAAVCVVFMKVTCLNKSWISYRSFKVHSSHKVCSVALLSVLKLFLVPQSPVKCLRRETCFIRCCVVMEGLAGYVILIVSCSDNKMQLYGSPHLNACDDLSSIDVIKEINECSFENLSYAEVLQYIEKCTKSKKISIKVKRGQTPLSFSNWLDGNKALACSIEVSGEQRLARLDKKGCVKRIPSKRLPTDLQDVLNSSKHLYLVQLFKDNFKLSTKTPEKSEKSETEQSGAKTFEQNTKTAEKLEKGESKETKKLEEKTLAQNQAKTNNLDKSLPVAKKRLKKPDNQTSTMAVAMPRSGKNHYSMNGGLGSVLPPDETTTEMAIDCPPAYVAAHPPRSGTSTPRSAFEVPPPTPLGGANGTKGKTAKDLEAAAEVASTLPQPEMNFQRIHRMRESARRQKEQKQRDARIRQQMAGEGAEKIDRLKGKGADEANRANLKGFENEGYIRDSYIDAGASHSDIGLEAMFASLNSISMKVDDPSLLDDLSFLKQLVQQDTFQEAFDLHKTLSSNASGHPKPITNELQEMTAEVCDDLQYSELPQATNLIKILCSPIMKGLQSAHDSCAEISGPPEDDEDDVNIHLEEDEEILRRISQYTDKKVRIVRIEKTSDALGATVRSEEDGTVTISRIISGGLASTSLLLHEGDEVIEVNGRSMRGLDVNEVGDVIGSMNGTLVFVLAAPVKGAGVNGNIPDAKDLAAVKHVRALFDYEALDDPYLPCRELGLSFQKGEVLRVMCVDDPDWWQAYRDDDADTHLTLAGLIPSQQFQHQRETIRISLTKESEAPESKKSLFCGKKKKKTKEAKKLYNADQDDEIHTYEEMALYHQPEGRKRPIVLIGPPNVGRHELRQRLVDNDRERFASPISHTTRPPQDGEQEGQDYHFVSVTEFESMVEQHKFVEYGSYQKTLYGTTVDCVGKIIDLGKICVLNLHAESLKALYTSGLKPYVVFIAPPPLERLRMNMSKEGKQLKEDELRKIIESAREIERTYAHYFDETIRNLELGRSYAELLRLINKLDNEPQWVPAAWLD